MPLKANRELRKFSKSCGHRLVTMAFEPEFGRSFAIEGCVMVEDVAEIAKLFRRVRELTAKVEPEPIK